jgi:hypothetical protein
MNLVCYNCGGFGHRTIKCCSPKINGLKLPHWNMIFKKPKSQEPKTDKKDENHFVNDDQQSLVL